MKIVTITKGSLIRSRTTQANYIVLETVNATILHEGDKCPAKTNEIKLFRVSNPRLSVVEKFCHWGFLYDTDDVIVLFKGSK